MIDNKAAFFDVIKVIENASKAELQAISRVEKAIENNGVTPVVEAVDKSSSSKRVDPRGRRPRARIAADSSNTESTLTVSSDHAETGSGSPVYQDATSTPYEPSDNNIAPERDVVVVVPESKPVEVSKDGSDRVQTLPSSTVQQVREGSVISDNSAITDALDGQAKTQAKQLSESSKMNKLLEGIYRDQKGEIRQKNGAFATRQQKELFEKQERTESSDEITEQSSLLRTLSDWAIRDEVSGNRAIDAGGTAIGGSFWLAAKEVKDLTTEAGSLLSNNNLTSIDGIKSGLTKAKESALNPIETGKRLLLGNGESDSNESVQAVSPATQTEQISSRDNVHSVSTESRPSTTPERTSATKPISQSETVPSRTKATETTSTVSHTEQVSSRDSGHGISTESSPSATQERNSPAEIVSKSESVASSTKATETQTTSAVTHTEQVSSRDNVNSVSTESSPSTTPERTSATKPISQSETVPPRSKATETQTTSTVTNTEQVSSRDNVHSVSSENVPRATEERPIATQPVPQSEPVPSSTKAIQTTSTTKTEQIENRKSGLSAADIRSRNNEPDNLVLVDAVTKQSAEYREYSDDHGKKLDDIKSAILANRDKRGGWLDMINSDRKKKNKRRRDRHHRRGYDRSLKPKRTPKSVTSVMQTSGKAIGGSVVADSAKKGAGMAARGAGVAVRGALRALPLIGTALMTAFDAYEGFNNTQTQRQVFNVKEGEEVTTGQKSAMALANVLDLGGLVSGGAGWLGDGLESLGVTGAAEAMSFDTGGMAKSIYNFFGGNDEPQNDETVKSEAKAQSTTKTGAIPSQGKFEEDEGVAHETAAATGFASSSPLTSTLQKESGLAVSRSEGVTSNGTNLGRDIENRSHTEVSDTQGFSSHPFLYPMPKQGHGRTSLPSVSAGEETTVSIEAEKHTPLVPSKSGAREEPTVIVNNDKELNSTVKQLLEETKKANRASIVKSSEASHNAIRNAHHNTFSINAGSRGASIPTTPYSITMQNIASDNE